jgi:hypothetical protein
MVERGPARDARANWESMALGSRTTIVEGRGKRVDLGRTASQLVQTQTSHQMIKPSEDEWGDLPIALNAVEGSVNLLNADV